MHRATGGWIGLMAAWLISVFLSCLQPLGGQAGWMEGWRGGHVLLIDCC
jgi:hypothetical protein